MNEYPASPTAFDLFRCIASDVSDTRETLHYEDGEPVTALEENDIARCFDDMDDAKSKLADLTEIFGELVGTVRAAVEALNTTPRFRVGDTDSYSIALRCDRVLARTGLK